MAAREIVELPHGATLGVELGRPTWLRDRRGQRWAELAWDEDRLVRAGLRSPDGSAIELEPGAGTHALLGPVDRIRCGAAEVWCGATRWLAPRHIPALDRPAALPAGAGSAVLGLLALLAGRAGHVALRYRGPYPTDGLWDALAECFRTETARAAFTAGAFETALAGRAREVPVDFAPAPFVREAVGPGLVAQLRDGIEVVWVDGLAYRRGATDGRRLLERDGGLAAALLIGGTPWHTAAWLAGDRERAERPVTAPPRLAERPLDDGLRRGLLALAARDAPALVGAALVRLDPPVRLGDPGLALAARDDRGLIVHAGLVERLDGEALVLALAAALAPLARALAQDGLAVAAGG